MDRAAKTEWQRRKRAAAALAAGRKPHKTGRPSTGRKAPKCHGDRAGQKMRARTRSLQANGDNGWAESKHPIMDAATAVALRHIKPDRRTYYLDPLYDEAVMAAALAILDGSDPDAAVAATLRAERDHRYHTAPLMDEMIGDVAGLTT